ncbi:type IV pilus modification protein PilV [Pseudomonas sp. PDM14]|uniref:type IV pilus modification protein PilV n=1 Tax=Pseudomonas sp. PDM14 TaxID=2769288 RepID=UPI00177FD395|nr:type IV pilus modification protein PilV [Pseudomonas sp. PDM14]MBD9485376.1 type IV pilus modification protein PilV [Pseudomonas sp. PDM14]
MNNHISRGFSLIEVMVTLILLTIGILGLVAMQGRGIQYTQDSVQRNNAAMLASEYMELARANSENLDGYILSELPAAGDCDTSTPTEISDTAKQLTCWANKVHLLLPDALALKDEFYACRSKNPGSCATGRALEVQLAWRASGDGCLDANAAADEDLSICRFRLRGEL